MVHFRSFVIPSGALLVALTLASPARAESPGVGLGAPPSTGLSVSDVAIPWSAVGFSPAATDSAAYGPDLLGLGPNGAWALWDPVNTQIIGSVRADTPAAAGGFAAEVDHADGLAWTTDGELIVMDESARMLTEWRVTGSVAERVASLPMSRLCPVGVRLVVDGDEVDGIDAFGNVRPLADVSHGLQPVAGPHLRPPAHDVRVLNGVVTVDGAVVAAPSDALAGRAYGEWLYVEAGVRGSVQRRVAISLGSGRQVVLAVGSVYRPAAGIASGPDGTFGYLSPSTDALHLVRVSP